MRKYINIWREMVGITRDFINAPHFKKIFIYGIALYAIALFALIRGDIYYVDDWHTSVRDLTWNHNSRYLATFILNDLATLGKGAVDSSPLLQIMGAILVVASSLILIYLIRGKFDLLGIIASLPLGLSPHFLQNFSYKFESLFMCVALFFAIVPFLFKENKRIFIVVSIISLTLMFMSYQAANGTYIILSLYFAFSAYFLKKRSFKDSAIFLAICVANLIVATLIYKLTINDHYRLVEDSYALPTIIPLNSHFFVGIWANLSAYLTMIFNDLKNTPYIWLVALMSVLFVINIAIRTNRPKIATIFATIAFLLFGICLSYGLYLVLQKPLFAPRAFYGFNAFIAIISIANILLINRANSHTIHKILHFISATIAIITAYFLISFANIYGNALKKQDEYLAFRNNLLLKDLGDFVPKGGNVMVYVEPYVNRNHPVTQRFMDKYGDITRIIPRDYMASHFADDYNYDRDDLCLSGQGSGEVVLKNAYHTIEKVKICYIVTQN